MFCRFDNYACLIAQKYELNFRLPEFMVLNIEFVQLSIHGGINLSKKVEMALKQFPGAIFVTWLLIVWQIAVRQSEVIENPC